MPSYIPIMKSRPAELQAVGNRSAAVKAGSTPLFEIAFEPTKNRPTLDDYLDGLAPLLAESVGAGQVVHVDGSTIDQTIAAAHTSSRFIPWLSGELKVRGVTYIPVIHLDSPAIVLSDAAKAAAVHESGVTLRIGDGAGRPNLATFAANLAAVTDAMGVSTFSIHLLLDYQAVQNDGDVVSVLAELNPWLSTLAGGPDSFASVHVAAGSFPAAISDMAVAMPHLIRRWDADLFRRMSKPTGLEVGFADFVINHPAPGPSVKRTPLPSLRYTADEDWLIWREKRNLPGNQSFRSVCRGVTGHAAWSGSSFSWGDQQIDLRKTHPSSLGAGGAKEWRAYATSHHLQAVVARLTSLGAP